VLAWNAGNGVVHMDANGNIKPDKKRRDLRIAKIVASIIALGAGTRDGVGWEPGGGVGWRGGAQLPLADCTGKGRAMVLGERLTLF